MIQLGRHKSGSVEMEVAQETGGVTVVKVAGATFRFNMMGFPISDDPPQKSSPASSPEATSKEKPSK